MRSPCPIRHFLILLPLLALTGCVDPNPWPENMPGHTYSGVVINSATGTPAAGAAIAARRPNEQKMPVFSALVGLASEEIGTTTADAGGRFTLRTNTGYANRLEAESADGRVTGRLEIHSRDASGLRVTLTPPDALFMYDEGADPTSPAFKAAEAAMNQVVLFADSRPREPLFSLDGYAARGVISQAALDNFAQHPKLFFGAKPAMHFAMGHRFIQMQDTHQPLTLHSDDDLLGIRGLIYP